MKNSPIQICSCFLFLLLPSNALLSQVLLNVNGDGKLSGNLQVNKQVLFGHNSTGGGTKLLWMPTLGAFRAGRLSSSSSNNWDPQNVGINSFATGQDPKATGDYSFVGGGRYNTTGGIVSFVGGGDRNSASGFGSFIGGGSSNTASGGSSAIGGGYSQTASGDYSFVGGGIINSATGESSFVGGGVLNSAVGENTFIGGGLYNEATGLYSWIGGGYSNIATGELSFIGGGESNIARSFGETVFGTFNLDYTPNSSYIYHSENRLFVIGNGRPDQRSNALTILRSGNTGIGTHAPKERLAVNGNIQLSNANLPTGLSTEILKNSPVLNLDINFRFSAKNTAFRGAAFRIDARDNRPLFQWISRSAGDTDNESSLMALLEAGNLGIGTNTPLSRISITPSDKEAKITLYDGNSPSDHYGMGISDNQLNYHVQTNTDSHVFYATGKNGDGIELMRIRGDGSVNIRNLPVGFGEAVMVDTHGNLLRSNNNHQLRKSALIIEELRKENLELKSRLEQLETKEQKIQELEAKLARIENLDNLLTKAASIEAKIANMEMLEDRIIKLENNCKQCCPCSEGSSVIPQKDNSSFPTEAAWLKQNQPNPFHRQTTIQYYLPLWTHQAELRIIDLSGKALKSFTLEEKGLSSIRLEGSTFPAGKFFYILMVDGQVIDTKKMILTK